jgi:hypothetical protein
LYLSSLKLVYGVLCMSQVRLTESTDRFRSSRQYECPSVHATARTVVLNCTWRCLVSFRKKSNLVLRGLLVDVGLGVVAVLLDLVAEGILGSGGTVSGARLSAMHTEDGRGGYGGGQREATYRVLMPTLESLATSLLASLEAPEVAPLTDSET